MLRSKQKATNVCIFLIKANGGMEIGGNDKEKKQE